MLSGLGRRLNRHDLWQDRIEQRKAFGRDRDVPAGPVDKTKGLQFIHSLPIEQVAEPNATSRRIIRDEDADKNHGVLLIQSSQAPI